MTNLEYAQEIHDTAQKLVDQDFGAHPKIRTALDVLGLLIAENRELRNRRDAVADTMNYSLPGGQRA